MAEEDDVRTRSGERGSCYQNHRRLCFVLWDGEMNLFFNGLPNISSILLNFFQSMKDFNGKNILNLTMMNFNGILSRVNVPRNLIRKILQPYINLIR